MDHVPPAPPRSLLVAALCALAACAPLAKDGSRATPGAGTGLAAEDARPEVPAVALEPPFPAWLGRAFTAPLPDDWPTDSLGRQDSQVVLLEDGRPLGPAHALHAVVQEAGGGAFSHWDGTLVFSSSDGTDPNTNGRRYVAECHGPVGLGRAGYAPLALRDPFALLPPDDAQAAAPAAGAPRIVWWYTIDALRADMLFAERDGQRVMPALSHFAETGAVRFERAYATSSFTKTATASMFTGLWPTRHRVLHGLLRVWPSGVELVFDLDRRFRTLAGSLAASGYDTWTHPYTLHVRPGDGMLAGFAHLGLDVDGAAPLPVPPPGARLFAYEHILGVHAPYAPSAAARARLGLPAPRHVDPAGTAWFEATLDGDAVRELREACLGEASDADERFARRVAWLQAQGLWDDTLLIVTADHGEGFLEHGLTQHGNSLHEEAVRVPLLLRFPAGDPRAALHGSAFPHRVSHADLYPTLLELTGAPPPPYGLDGASLLPILDGREADPLARDVLLRCSFTRRTPEGDDALHLTDAILHGTRKAHFGYRIQGSQDAAAPFAGGDWFAELFDLDDDPAERRNLAPERPDEFLGLMQRHAATCAPLLPRGAARALPGDAPAPQQELLDPAEADRLHALRQLGYLR